MLLRATNLQIIKAFPDLKVKHLDSLRDSTVAVSFLIFTIAKLRNNHGLAESNTLDLLNN